MLRMFEDAPALRDSDELLSAGALATLSQLFRNSFATRSQLFRNLFEDDVGMIAILLRTMRATQSN